MMTGKAGEIICPRGTVSIGSRAFAGCSRLSRIYIPSTVQYIAEDAFDQDYIVIVTEHVDRRQTE